MIDGIWAALDRDDPDSHQTQSLLQIQSYGGKINQPDEDTWEFTSVAQRSSVLKWQPQTYWRESSAEADAEHAAWIRELYVRAFAESNGIPLDNNFEGCYINYPDLDMTYLEGVPGEENSEWYSIYFPDDRIRNRLIETKNQWDPRNIFRNEMSVPLG